MWDALIMFGWGVVTGVNVTIIIKRWLNRPKLTITAETER